MKGLRIGLTLAHPHKLFHNLLEKQLQEPWISDDIKRERKEKQRRKEIRGADRMAVIDTGEAG